MKPSLSLALAIKRKNQKPQKEHFLSDEDDMDSPFQDASEGATDEEMLEASDDQASDKMNNVMGNENEDEARRGVVSRIMAQVRRRAMGKSEK